MEASARRFIKVDFWIQTVLGSIVFLTSFMIYGLMLLLPFGIWQVISSLVWTFVYKNKQRIGYLKAVGAWTIVSGLLMLIEVDFFPLIFIWVIVVTAGIGIWYYVITRRDYTAEKNDRTPHIDDLDDILDAGL